MTEKSKVGVNLNGNSRVFGAPIGGETIESTWKIHMEGRSRSQQVILEGEERKKWRTSSLLAHAARIAKPTLRVVTIDVGVVATTE